MWHDRECGHEHGTTCACADEMKHGKHGGKSTMAKVMGAVAIAGTVALAAYGIARCAEEKCRESASEPDGAPLGDQAPHAA
jgi:hypothetical protein